MPYATVRGVNLYYEEYGSPDDPPLLVAHGLMGSIVITKRFGEAADAFAPKGLRVFAYDARGHGRSGYTTKRADYHWSALGEDMYGLVRALGLDTTNVYGGSMGAGTAIMLALNHPEVVEKLILMAPPPFGQDLKPAARMFGGLSYLFQVFGTPLTAKMIMLFPQARRAAAENPRNDLRSFLGVQRRASIVPAIRGLLLDEAQLPVERLDEIAHQTLVLTHPDDVIHPLRSGEVLHEKLAHARLAVAPTANYWPENPQALTHVVAAFIKGETIASGLPVKVVHEHA
jgi:pimeloyl-ACP methyl ester carboxylesterase